uniref:Enkurin domain-containing protein n=1 Tax=Salmo trutta TaxID=8032 RepID=A0A673YU18_SALTR
QTKLGPTKVDVPSPEKYLLEHSKEPKLTEKTFSHLYDTFKKTQIAAKTYPFENIMAVLRKPQPIYDFGKNPEYLQQHADEVRRAQDKYESYVNEHIMRQGAIIQLSEDDKNGKLISLACVIDGSFSVRGLKKNWGELHHQYQGLCCHGHHPQDVLGTIDLIERYKAIYTANNN